MFIAMQYGLILGFTTALVICVVNIYRILIKQGRWRTIPLLGFYTLAVSALTSRLVTIILLLVPDSILELLTYTAMIAKLGVGLI